MRHTFPYRWLVFSGLAALCAVAVTLILIGKSEHTDLETPAVSPQVGRSDSVPPPSTAAQTPVSPQGGRSDIPRVARYFTTPLENDSSRVVRLQKLLLPPGTSNEFHRHPGDQWAAVQEGEIAIAVNGQPPRILRVGDSVFIPRGTIHSYQNLTSKPAIAIEAFIIDKDKPAAELVQ
jgi:quercetin dioxygenase-like cupin family protein